jgi:hypothetical protein
MIPVGSPGHRPNPSPFADVVRPLRLPGGRPGRHARAGGTARGWITLFTRESALVVVAILVYFLVRGMMATSVDRAYANAHALLDLERALGIAREADLQRWASDVAWLDPLMARLYIFGHWPVIALTLAWLLWRDGERFRAYRMAMVLSGLAGIFLFALYPMAPPRFLPDLGFVDTVLRDTSSYRVLQPPALTNQYAAFPSLHVGWNLLMGIAIYSTTRAWYARAFAVVMPLVMYAATILTANHYLLDGLAGSAIALAALAVAMRIRSRSDTPVLVEGEPAGTNTGDYRILPPDTHSQPSNA